jgi:hypothetical protein
MKILFLGYSKSETSLIDFLENEGHVVNHTSDKISVEFVSKFDFVVSFGYRHIIKRDIIDVCDGKLINLHISLLPYNRGSHPNFWSFYDDTPSGVTIHQIDEGLDTGDILLQKECEFDIEVETFSSTYTKLINEIENLFKSNINRILDGSISPRKQIGSGTYHKSSDLPGIQSWNTNIKRYLEMDKRSDNDIINEIEQIRARNNVNWMDAVRLAFELDADRARTIFKDIKECDARINELLNELADNE